MPTPLLSLDSTWHLTHRAAAALTRALHPRGWLGCGRWVRAPPATRPDLHLSPGHTTSHYAGPSIEDGALGFWWRSTWTRGSSWRGWGGEGSAALRSSARAAWRRPTPRGSPSAAHTRGGLAWTHQSAHSVALPPPSLPPARQAGCLGSRAPEPLSCAGPLPTSQNQGDSAVGQSG